MLEKQGNAVRLGDLFKDVITGVRGTATAQCRHLTGSDTIRLEWGIYDGESHNEWVDINRLEWHGDAPNTELADLASVRLTK